MGVWYIAYNLELTKTSYLLILVQEVPGVFYIVSVLSGAVTYVTWYRDYAIYVWNERSNVITLALLYSIFTHSHRTISTDAQHTDRSIDLAKTPDINQQHSYNPLFPPDRIAHNGAQTGNIIITVSAVPVYCIDAASVLLISILYNVL